MSQSRLLSCLVPVEGCLLQFSVLLQSTESSTAFPGLCEEELWDHLQTQKRKKHHRAAEPECVGWAFQKHSFTERDLGPCTSPVNSLSVGAEQNLTPLSIMRGADWLLIGGSMKIQSNGMSLFNPHTVY